MNRPLRIALYAAITGLILALVGGIFGAVDFGIIVIRMLLSAAIAAAFGAGTVILVQKYLPELFTSNETPDTALSKPEVDNVQGETVDIVVDDDFEQAALRDEESKQSADDPISGAETADKESLKQELASVGDSSELPNLEEWADTFSGKSGESNEVKTASGNSSAGASSGGTAAAGTEDDPKLIARAIQTLLKKE